MSSSLILYDKLLLHTHNLIISNIYNYSTFCKIIEQSSNSIQINDLIYIKVKHNPIIQEIGFYPFFSSVSDKKELFFFFFDSFIQTLENLSVLHHNLFFFLAFTEDNLLFSQQFNKPYFYNFHNCFLSSTIQDFEQNLFSFVKNTNFIQLPFDLQIFKCFLESSHYNYSYDDIASIHVLPKILKYNPFLITLFGKKSFSKHAAKYIQQYYHNKSFQDILTHLYNIRFAISIQGVVSVYAQLFWKIIDVDHSNLSLFQEMMTFFSKYLLLFNNTYTKDNIEQVISFLHNKFYHIKNPNDFLLFIQKIRLLH